MKTCIVVLCLSALASLSAGQDLYQTLCDNTNVGTLLGAYGWCQKGVPMCALPGVKCDNKLRIVGLTLDSRPLAAPLKSIFPQPYSYLKELKIRNCSLTGEMPESFANNYLLSLDLSHNQLTGSAPWDWLMMVSEVNLENNRLSGAPGLAQQNYQYTRISVLRAANNQLEEDLTGMPPEFAARFRVLNISNNRFSGIAPAAVNAMEYDISGNQFTGIQNWPANLTKPMLLGNSRFLVLCSADPAAFTPPVPDWIASYDWRCLPATQS